MSRLSNHAPRRLVRWSVGVSAACLGLIPPAQSKTTCHDDESGRKLCCETWRVKIYASGKENGSITEPAFDNLARRVASHRKTARSLCAYGFQSDCNITYGQPHCADSNAKRTSPEQLLERREVQAVIDNAHNLIRHWGQTLTSAVREVATADGRPNPYQGVGSAMAIYADALRDARDKLQEMTDILARVDDQVTIVVIRELDRHSKEFEHCIDRLRQALSDLPPGDHARLIQLPPLGTARPNGTGPDNGARHRTSPIPDRPALTAAPVDTSCPDLTHCLRLIDAVWSRSDSKSGQRQTQTGTMSIKLTNTCAVPLRLALWLPQGSEYAPSYFRLEPNSTTSRTAIGIRNEWHIQASQTNASDHCLKYP